jgi:hypothetical protein
MMTTTAPFLDRTQLLTQKLLKQGYVATMLKSSIENCYVRHSDMVDCYEIFISHITRIFYYLRRIDSFPLSISTNTFTTRHCVYE